jgi:hypothetical protein
MNTDTQVRILEIELAKARAEATALRKALGENGRHKRRIEKAFEDAILMAFWSSVGIRPARRFAERYGITQDRWMNAIALFRMARLIEGRSRWRLADLETTERKLAAARDKVLSDPGIFLCATPPTGSGWVELQPDAVGFPEIIQPIHEYKFGFGRRGVE